MTVQTIPDIELVITAWLDTHPFLAALEARIGGQLPEKQSAQSAPWVRVTQLDASDVGGRERLIDYLLQFECYAGAAATLDFRGQAEASLLARTVRAALKDAQGQVLNDTTVVTSVRFVGMNRVADPDFEPARQRYILTAAIHAHIA